MTHIVVGVDGSESAAQALDWAHREAELRDCELTAVLAWGLLNQHHADDRGFNPDYGISDARAALDAYLEAGLGAERAEDVRRRVPCDLPAPALLNSAASASLLVVGARGRGGFTGLLLGSVSQQCLHHAPCPIAILRPDTHSATNEATTQRIVVGIDGSAVAAEALAWAVHEARLRGAHLEVIHTWYTPYVAAYPYVPAFDPGDFQVGAEATIDAALQDLDVTGLAEPIERIVAEGRPAPSILEAAKGADLVVLGSRGLGSFAGMLIGSVSHQVAQHAECPVVIVPPGSNK